LLVWANPGQSGAFEDPSSWLLNGERMKQWPRPTGHHFGLVFFTKEGTDFLFPASSKRYKVRPRRTSARTRHITTEAGADAEIAQLVILISLAYMTTLVLAMRRYR